MVEDHGRGGGIHQGDFASGPTLVLDPTSLDLAPDQGRIRPARWTVAVSAIHLQRIAMRRLRG